MSGVFHTCFQYGFIGNAIAGGLGQCQDCQCMFVISIMFVSMITFIGGGRCMVGRTRFCSGKEFGT